MNRRDALKNLGMVAGYAATLPSAFSILQSCTTDEKKWTPLFFSNEEGIVIKNLVNIILPKTENMVGALDVNVPEFIDLYAHKALLQEDIEAYRLEIAGIMLELPITEKGAIDLKSEDYETLLSKYLKADKNQQKQYEDDENITYLALVNLRSQSIWAYKTSALIGEEVLAYDPIPGQQIGCLPLKDATNGKSWSLQ